MYVPPLLFHGSRISGISVLVPRGVSKPDGASGKPAVYATPKPAVAAVHGIGWTSSEGVDFYVREEGSVCLILPERLQSRLGEPLSIYTVSSLTFSPTLSDNSGTGWFSLVSVDAVDESAFSSALAALRFYHVDIKLKRQ